MASSEPTQAKASDTRDGFRFRGGHVALDFPATLAARRQATPRELLALPSDLSRWLVAAGLTASALLVTQDDLETAKQLREAIYAVAVARIEGTAPPVGALDALNRIAAGEAAILKLDRDGQMRLLGSARALLTSLAHEAIRLFGAEQADRIRQCESETCALLFLDLSRSGDRRWCSMSGCGNRAKVAEFRRRKRAAPT
ncbi:CGNR zinc finger domain-containing protein [Roseiterribacter gracilis]|uniref:Zinc finger CGNR domain-containing protein n=1 Tax=Roseiterribacter gracilis TaxID=2812848 RepID=A0A8S8XJC0_9PROT|nr:hypothetical protein TMPK1_35020 [Rhodospirillales bacterium TMPK1]